MSNNNSKKIKTQENTSAPMNKNMDSPRQMNASEDVAPMGTNAGGKPVSGKPKKN